MEKVIRSVVVACSLAVAYACSATSPGEGASSSGTPGGSSDASIADASATSDVAIPVDAATSSDGSADALVDGGDAGACSCIHGYTSGGTPVSFPGGENCLGGCTFVKDAATPSPFYEDSRSSCRLTCNDACAPDPPYGGVCPAECTGGCADGVCNIVCDGSDPSKTCVGNPGSVGTWVLAAPIVKCPDGMPCRVTCRNGACNANVVACPRDASSCEIDCGLAGGGCGSAHLYCGPGRCKVSGAAPGIGEGGKGSFAEYNMWKDVCGHSCACELPVPAVFHNQAGTRCLCKDGSVHGGGMPGEDYCPAVCAAHGGWSAPWERTVGSR